MVPCQPRQLVILSLPFAALVAFFWFKRRKSLSRSDPGGTFVDKKLLCDSVPTSKEVVVKNIVKVDQAPAKEEEIVKKEIEHVGCFLTKPEEKIIESFKSVENIPAVEKKEVICNGGAVNIKDETEKEFESHPLTPEFENTRIFHSTIIESETDFDNNKKDNPVEVNQTEEAIYSCKEEELESVGHIEEHNSVATLNEEGGIAPKEKLIKLENIPLEDQSTLENIDLKDVENKPLTESSTPILVDDPGVKTDSSKDCASSVCETVERIENISTDTGLGSQDPSAVEESNTSMAQGQKTEDKSQNNATGLEQKLASLGLDTQQPAQRSERDSANHSPAEVMLNSPAISTFSDAHSEGSSDSGKGCSDVVTPPSRTPAGGSSVAGDQLPSVYEFVLPQVIVGRLIGRHGTFLHDIRAKTHTNVFIKKHPETNNLKICAIEGTQQDIDAALKMIRQKFPLRRFPDLTLERVTFVKNPCLPINPENLQLHLVEGVNNDVIISSLITAGHFFLQMPMHMSYQSLYRLACIMNSVYNTQESPPLVEPQPDVVCVAPAHGGWYRAQILSVDEETNTSEIKFLDYGGYMSVDNATLRQIRGDFLLLPFQAVECVLANVLPTGGEEEWSEDARQFVQLMTTNQTLQAQVYDYTETGLPLVYLYCTQFYQSPTDPSGYETKVVLLNQELVSRGYADLIDSSQEDGQTAATESS